MLEVNIKKNKKTLIKVQIKLSFYLYRCKMKWLRHFFKIRFLLLCDLDDLIQILYNGIYLRVTHKVSMKEIVTAICKKHLLRKKCLLLYFH